MRIKKLLLVNFMRLLLTVLCAAVVYWIFSNSLENAAVSSSRSESVTEGVQDAIGAIAPSSPIANASGSDFDKLHAFVRKCAHFSEYALLGFLLMLSCLAYTPLKRFWFVPPCTAFLVAVFDEYIQTLSPGRACSLVDVFIDTSGAAAGILLAGLCVFAVSAIVKRYRRKAEKKSAATGA